MALISRQKTWVDNEVLLYTDLNNEFNEVFDEFNGNIDNANVKSAAGIVYSKLSLTNSILNADINSSAAIAYSKLSLTGSILNADVNASAAIAYSKLNLSGGIVNADVSASAAIAASKLADVVTTNTTQTVSGVKTFSAANTFSGNNTFSAYQTFSKATKSALVTASDGATVTFDLNEGNIQSVTLGGNRTLALSNASVGQVFVLRLVQDGTGSRTVTWFSTIKWPYNTVPTLTTTASKTDVFGFICTSSGNYDGFIVGQEL